MKLPKIKFTPLEKFDKSIDKNIDAKYVTADV